MTRIDVLDLLGASLRKDLSEEQRAVIAEMNGLLSACQELLSAHAFGDTAMTAREQIDRHLRRLGRSPRNRAPAAPSSSARSGHSKLRRAAAVKA